VTAQEPLLAARESASGAIYDLGYQGYDGPRLGRRAAVATLFWASMRAAFGLGRSGRAKIVPWGVTALLLIPAGVTVAIASLSPQAPAAFDYDNFLWNLSTLVAIFVAAQAPELVSSDQRHRVLSLYFSHALERSDYALAKLGALAAAIFLMTFAPMLLLFLGRVLLAADVVEAFGDELGQLPQVIGAPLIYAIPLAAFSLAIAAFTPRRAYATGAIIAVFLVGAAIGGILGDATSGALADLSQLANPFVPLDGTRDWLVGASIVDSPVGRMDYPMWVFSAEALAVTVIATIATLWRYRGLQA
jgi:ABC-2 type transport system permease protein